MSLARVFDSGAIKGTCNSNENLYHTSKTFFFLQYSLVFNARTSNNHTLTLPLSTNVPLSDNYFTFKPL